MAGGGVERVPAPGGACWICGLPAVCGEKLPGRLHKVRGLGGARFQRGQPVRWSSPGCRFQKIMSNLGPLACDALASEQ